ncbi:MAG TPA: choice-of-anchor D domain-containing protein, partial [Thermomicrobiales bacterium]|nr:choice-of-anchor D domain-containing protein [Thermomicrobiales bacterium]
PMLWRRCAQGILAVLVALGLALGGFTARGGRAAPAIIATIPVGGAPGDAAIDPTTGRIYVANDTSGTISVIDSASNTVVATIPIPRGIPVPMGVAVNPATNRVYVTYLSSVTSTAVAVIDGATNTVVTTIPLASTTCCAAGTFGVAVDPATNRVYVAVASDPPGVAVIDGATNTVVTTIPLDGTPYSVAVNPSTNRVYATYQVESELFLAVIDGATDTGIDSVDLGAATGIFSGGVAVNPVTNRIYAAIATSNGVGPPSGGALVVLNGDTNAIVATVPMTGVPAGVAVNPVTAQIFVAESNSFSGISATERTSRAIGGTNGSLVTLDGGTNAVASTLPLDAAPVGVVVAPGTGLRYVTLASDNSVAVVGEQSVGLSASALAFGDQPVSVAGAPQTVTLTNTGQGTVGVSGVAVAGANSGDFVKTSDACSGAALAPGATCAVGVAFAPTAVGNRAATLLFTDNVADSPQRVALGGAGTPAPPSGPSGWSAAWNPLGGVLTDSPAAAGLNGTLYVFAAGTDHALYVRSSADGAAFTPWRSLGGILTAAPAAASNNGRLYVFAKGSDSALYVMSTADGASWTGWTRLGGILTAPPAATSVNGTLYVLARGSDSALYLMRSTDGVTWSGWQNLGGVLTAAPAAAGLNGTLYVFAAGTDHALYVRSSADGAAFTPWRSLGGLLTAAPAAASNNGRL